MTTDWPPAEEPGPSRPARRGWPAKFGEAARGVRQGVRGEASFAVHFFFAALAVLAAVVLECDRVDWCLVVGCVGFVFSVELLNTAVETLFHGLDRDTKDRLVGVLDVSAGAVLVAAGTAIVVGGIVFGHRLVVLLKG